MYRRLISVLLAVVLLTACGASAGNAFREEQSSEAPMPAAEPAMAPSEGEAAPDAAAGGADTDTANTENPSTQNPAPFGRKVIRTATLSLQVDNADVTEAKVRALVDGMGGYVLNSQTSGDEDRRSVQLTFKVPVERFDEALSSIESLALKVQNRNVTGQDVTDEYIDVQARVRNLAATEARLLEFLKEAKTTEEALMVNEQLTVLQGQIEQAKGRIQYLEQSVAYSTITVDLQPKLLLTFTADEGWTPWTAASIAWNSLLEFAQGLADVAIAFAVWSPVWGILLLIGLGIWRRVRRTAPQQPTPPQPTPQG